MLSRVNSFSLTKKFGNSQQLLEKSFRKFINTKSSSICSPEQVALKNACAKYTVEEVEIPKTDGRLAGKLYQAEPLCGSPPLKHYAPIVCIHGWLDNCGSFDPLIPLIIKPNMKILTIDLPGHGYSCHTKSTHYDFVIDSYYTIHRIIQHFDFKKITLLGHSMGSIVSYLFAGLFPEHVDRYIGLDNMRPIPSHDVTTMRIAPEVLLKVEQKLSKHLPPPSYTYEEILQRTYEGRKKAIDIDKCEILLQRGASRQPNGKYVFNHDLKVTIPTSLGKFSERQTLDIGSAIRCPVCIIKGEPGIDYEPREKFMEAVDNLRKTASYVEFHAVPGTHHFHLNEPKLVAPIVSKFLDL